MTDLKSFIVVLHFGPPGPLLTCGAYLAPDQASAAAMATANIMRQHGIEAPLLSCLVVEESVESLRERLRAIEGKPAGDVVSLVPTHINQRAAELLRTVPMGAMPVADLGWTLPPDGNIRRSGWQPDDPFDPVA